MNFKVVIYIFKLPTAKPRIKQKSWGKIKSSNFVFSP